MNQWDTEAQVCALLEMKMEIWFQGKKGLCRNMVTHSFQNMKNKFTLKKKKKNGSDRFILSYLEVSPLSLCVKDQREQARPRRQEDSLHAHCHQVGPLLTGPCFLTQMWLSGLSQKWKSQLPAQKYTAYVHGECCYHSQRLLQIWMSIPEIGFLIQKGQNTLQ